MSDGGSVWGALHVINYFPFSFHRSESTCFQGKQKTRKAQWGLVKLSFVLLGWRLNGRTTARGVGQDLHKGDKSIGGGQGRTLGWGEGDRVLSLSCQFLSCP